MFDQNELIDVAPSPAALVAAVGSHGCRRARLGVATAHTEVAGAWAADGATSFPAWLRHAARMSRRDASQLTREGRWLVQHPAIAEAAVDGRLSWSQVGVIMSMIRLPYQPLFREHEAALVPTFSELDIEQTIIALCEWLEHADAFIDIPPRKEMVEGWTMHRDDDGSLTGRFVVGPDIGALIESAFETARTFSAGDDRSPSERNADAASSIFAFFNANHERTGTPRHRAHVELIMNAAFESDPQRLFESVFAGGCVTTLEGVLLPDWAADALTCDCVIHRVMAAGSATTDYGRKTRTVPLPLFRRVALRDGGCRFPGCDRKVAWTDAHHIEHWRHLGRTEERNLLLLCAFHHRLVHRDAWEIVLHADATATFTAADGRVLTSRPRGPCGRQRAPVTT